MPVIAPHEPPGKVTGASPGRNLARLPCPRIRIGGRVRRRTIHLLLAACVSACATADPGAALPPAQALRFSEFFVLPVGERGQVPTERLLSLRGQRVAVEGYIVEEEEPFPGFFMLTPLPVGIPERADGPSDFLPPATLFVHLPQFDRDAAIPWRPGLWRATGTLELGPREEASGRISYARLLLEDLTSVPVAEVENHAESKE
jgi:hypothetical protein